MIDIDAHADALRSSNKNTRRNAIIALGKSQNSEALNYLKWAYQNDPDQELQALALKAGKHLRSQMPSNDRVNLSLAQENISNKPELSKYDFSKLDNPPIDPKIPTMLEIALGSLLFFSVFMYLFMIPLPFVTIETLPIETGGTIGDLIDSYVEQSGIMGSGEGINYGNTLEILNGKSNPIDYLLSIDQQNALRQQGVVYPNAIIRDTSAYQIYVIMLYSLPLGALLYLIASFALIGRVLPVRRGLISLADFLVSIGGINGVWVLVLIIAFMNVVVLGLIYSMFTESLVEIISELLNVPVSSNYAPIKVFGAGYWGTWIYHGAMMLIALIGLTLRSGDNKSS